MVKVAVAGGTGSIGKLIVDAILATKKHEVVVLSRSPNPALESRGVTVIPVSYTDSSSLERALQGVHTVISTIGVPAELDAWAASQIALLEAAKKVGVKRFAPSEFAARALPNDPLVGYTHKAKVLEEVARSELEYTFFESGLWMNFLADGSPRLGQLQLPRFVVDVERCTATIPGDGTFALALTRTEDIAAFVAASLDLPEWPEVSKMVGDSISWNEVTALAEKVRGMRFILSS